MMPDSPKPTSFIVSTDLDGTLLDHDDYSWQAAAPALERLKSRGVPIIINTSKTRDEVIELQAALGIREPFIVENGSAIYLPDDDPRFSAMLDQAVRDDEHPFHIKILGSERSRITDWLNTVRQREDWRFDSFSDWTVEQIMERTGLDSKGARLAARRQYSEPLVWTDNETNKQAFIKAARRENLNILQGGRFLHVLGSTDKGTAISWFKQAYQNRNPNVQIIALGDSGNDVAMLKVAEYPVVIKSPSHDYPSFKSAYQPLFTEAYGPSGWNQAIINILENTQGTL